MKNPFKDYQLGYIVGKFNHFKLLSFVNSSHLKKKKRVGWSQKSKDIYISYTLSKNIKLKFWVISDLNPNL